MMNNEEYIKYTDSKNAIINDINILDDYIFKIYIQESAYMINNFDIEHAMTIKIDDELPNVTEFEVGIRRAPDRGFTLSKQQAELALKNALRYVPEKHHEKLAPEFMEELITKGRIYGYRFKPEGRIYGKPINEYKGNCIEGKAFQVMIDNNLNSDIALYPYELVTYGETGQVCQNWMQYTLIKKYLENLTQDQTLVLESGHPLGLFKSSINAPRVIITNGLMIGMFDNSKDWHEATQLGVANYGQMTAGGWMYIGPQGIVHGTFNTLLNAGRLKLGIPDDGDLRGRTFITSGLGGMSGAQPKAIEIANGIGIIAEVDYSRIKTRLDQGWVNIASDNLKEIFEIVAEKVDKQESISIAYHGNIVDLLQYVADKNIKIDLLSDQTSCHAPYDGGYAPQGVTFDQRTNLLKEDREKFRQLVDKTLIKHFELVKIIVARGTYFFDYGNAFMKAVYDAGAIEIAKNGVNEKDGFIFPSYVEDIMGPMLFDYGYGPFRWVCLSGNHDDLVKTDKAAMGCIDPKRRGQDRDNYIWIRDAEKNKLVVGTEARILYQDAQGRIDIALKFNNMVRTGEVGPIMLGRDHHDVSGTDSPFRETSNIKDGSNVMADMAVQCFAGNAARGMSLIALHNGGGVGIGKSINGGFGLVLDGSDRVDSVINSSIAWDVMGGVARRAWARNPHSIETSIDYNKKNTDVDHITLPYLTDEKIITKTIEQAFTK
ncbi:MAG: urocanate hydratase [Clostridium sp.]|jgi:urocanate hydratase